MNGLNVAAQLHPPFILSLHLVLCSSLWLIHTSRTNVVYIQLDLLLLLIQKNKLNNQRKRASLKGNLASSVQNHDSNVPVIVIEVVELWIFHLRIAIATQKTANEDMLIQMCKKGLHGNVMLFFYNRYGNFQQCRRSITEQIPVTN